MLGWTLVYTRSWRHICARRAWHRARSMAGCRHSSDGRLIAFCRLDPASGAGDLWLEEVASHITTRLTSHPGYDWIAIWSPDGHRVAFASNREATMDL
jgi:tricorn protease